MPIHEEMIDFKDNHEKSKEWLDKKSRRWNDILYENDFKNEFEHFVKYDQDIINRFLNTHEGKLISKFDEVKREFIFSFPDFNREKLQYIVEQIKKLERVIAKSEVEETITIYTNSLPPYPESSVAYWDIFQPPHEIEHYEFIDLRAYLEDNPIIKNYGFFSGSLTSNITKKRSKDGIPFLFEVIVPRGLEAGYNKNEYNDHNFEQIVLNRNYGWKILGIKITENVEDGSDLAVVSVKLIENT